MNAAAQDTRTTAGGNVDFKTVNFDDILYMFLHDKGKMLKVISKPTRRYDTRRFRDIWVFTAKNLKTWEIDEYEAVDGVMLNQETPAYYTYAAIVPQKWI